MWPIYEKLHCCAVLIIIKNDKSTDINVECERLSSGIKGVEQPHRKNQNIYSGHFRNTYEKIIWSRDYVTCLGELLDGLRTICREYALKIWRLCINKLAKGRKTRKHHFPLTSWAISRSSGNLLPRSERYWTSEALIWAIPELELFSCCAGSSSSLAWLFLFFLFFLSEQWYVRWY